MQQIKQFIEDFKSSMLFNTLLQDTNLDIIMVWLTGSTITGITDAESDYDMCVLVRELPQEALDQPYRNYSRPRSYFMKYLPQNKRTQYLYNDLKSITSSQHSIFMDNIGWAQFKYITEEFIIYKNPHYLNFIEMLINRKIDIYKNALQLFTHVMTQELFQGSAFDESKVAGSKPQKILYHVCWAADDLQGSQKDITRLLRIKRQPFNQLSEEDKKYILESAQYLKSFYNNVAPILDNFEFQNYAEEVFK